MEDSRVVLLATYILLNVLILLTNLGIIFVIISSPALRKSPKNHMIISMAVADLLMGSFVLPMFETSLAASTVPLCHAHITLQVLGDFGVFFVVGFELVTFNILQFQSSYTRLQWSFLQLPSSASFKSIFFVLWPWLAALCILVPATVATTSLETDHHFDGDVMCMMKLPMAAVMSLFFCSLYLPFMFSVGALLAAISFYFRGYHKQPPAGFLMEEVNPNPSEELAESERFQEPPLKENPMLLMIPYIVYIVCYLPLVIHVGIYLHDGNIPYIRHFPDGAIVFSFLARSALLPLSWLVYADIRQDLKKYGRASCSSNPRPSSTSAVSFNRLQEGHHV